MRGRLWVVVGLAVGVAVGVGRLPYFAGAAVSLADTALRVVGTGALTLVHGAAARGAPRRIVEGIAAVVAVLVPGVTALLLVLTARAVLLVRTIVALLVGALGAAAFAYLPHGDAFGALVLALAVAAIALLLTGPLVVAPLSALAALIGTVYLPRLVSSRSAEPTAPVAELHRALFASGGSPLWLALVLLLVAVLPFAWAARLAFR
jgi:hypothetical protein